MVPSQAATVERPHFTATRGIYFAPLDLTIWSPTADAKLVITSDGSQPALTNGTATTGTNLSLRITNTSVIRAVAFREGSQASGVETHSYIFPASVASQTAPPNAATFWPESRRSTGSSPAGVNAHFAMDTRVVTNPLPGYEVTNALVALPALSIVTANEGLFGTNGIYARSLETGPQWTRRASIELIYADGRAGFQHNCGLRMRGGASRISTFSPKHSFTVLFQKEFGEGKLDFQIFPDSPRHKFNGLALRANSNDAWPVTHWPHQVINGEQRWVRERATYIRDQWVRDTQRAMGQPSAHGMYAHLYLNGLYWGIYNVAERPDAEFAAKTFGGEKHNYDVISDGTDLHDGDRKAWDQLRGAYGLEENGKFQRLLGNNPDGTRNSNFPVLLDVTNLVDYMVLHIFIGADDWPEHNWWVARDRGPQSSGFKFFAWDQEISINSLVKQHTAWALLRGGARTYAEESWGNTPAEVYSHCRASAEFRKLFGERVQKHLFADGALSVSNNIARWRRLTNVLDCAIVAESARWGAFQRPDKPYRREVEWLAANEWECSVYFPSNQFVALKRFRDAKLYSGIAASPSTK